MGTQGGIVTAITTVLNDAVANIIQLYAHIVTFSPIIHKGTKLAPGNFFTFSHFVLKGGSCLGYLGRCFFEGIFDVNFYVRFFLKFHLILV